MIMAQVNSPESLDRVPSDHLEIGDELAIVPRKLLLVLNWQSRPINYGGHDVVRAEDATAVWDTLPGVGNDAGGPVRIARRIDPSPKRRRVPVFTAWHAETGPTLAMGRLTAAARLHRKGMLAAHFDIHPPMTAEEALERCGNAGGPAILLCSDYVWTIESQLDLARRAKRRSF